MRRKSEEVPEVRSVRDDDDFGVVRVTETLSVERLADRLGSKGSTVRRMIREGLPYRRVGRRQWISGRSFQRFIEAGEQTGGEPCEENG